MTQEQVVMVTDDGSICTFGCCWDSGASLPPRAQLRLVWRSTAASSMSAEKTKADVARADEPAHGGGGRHPGQRVPGAADAPCCHGDHRGDAQTNQQTNL